MSDGHFSLVLISYSFCGVTESGGRGLAVAPSAFVVVSMVVSTTPVVLVACTVGLVITARHAGYSASHYRMNWGKQTFDIGTATRKRMGTYAVLSVSEIFIHELLPCRPAYFWYFARILTHLRFLCPNLYGSHGQQLCWHRQHC
jgi:hypothetical protein